MRASSFRWLKGATTSEESGRERADHHPARFRGLPAPSQLRPGGPQADPRRVDGLQPRPARLHARLRQGVRGREAAAGQRHPHRPEGRLLRPDLPQLPLGRPAPRTVRSHLAPGRGRRTAARQAPGDAPALLVPRDAPGTGQGPAGRNREPAPAPRGRHRRARPAVHLDLRRRGRDRPVLRRVPALHRRRQEGPRDRPDAAQVTELFAKIANVGPNDTVLDTCRHRRLPDLGHARDGQQAGNDPAKLKRFGPRAWSASSSSPRCSRSRPRT